jgi:hypothetical protein
MDSFSYIIRFDDVSGAEANLYASELRNLILDTGSNIEVHQRRDDPRTMDFGATLVLILGTPAVITAAKAVGDWLKLRNTASLTIEKDGHVIAQNLTSKDAAKLAELFLTQPGK